MNKEALAPAGIDQDAAPGSKEEMRCKQEWKKTRSQIVDTLESTYVAATKHGDFGLIDRSVIKQYKDATEFDALQKDGDQSAPAKIEALHEMKHYADKLSRDVLKFSSQLREAIEIGKKEAGLTDVNIKHMQEKLSQRRGNWEAVKAFFTSDKASEQTLAGWMTNWKKIGKKLREVEAAKAKLAVDPKSIPAVAALQSDKFKKGKVVERLQMLQDALDAMTGTDTGLGKMRAAALALYRDAASRSAIPIPQGKINEQLATIFQKYKGENLQKFIQSELPRRLSEWVRESPKIVALCKKAKEAGIQSHAPEDFVDMSYPQRRSAFIKLHNAIREGNNKPANPALGTIQRKIDAQDLKGARTILTEVKHSSNLGSKDQKRLTLLEMSLKQHEAESTAKKATEDKDKAAQQLHMAHGDFLTSVHTFGTPAVETVVDKILEEKGSQEDKRLYGIRKGFGNVQWGVEHNWLDKEKVGELRERAEDDTKNILRHGHKDRGAENIDLSTKTSAQDKESIARKYEHGQRGVVFYHFKKEDSRKVLTDIDERGAIESHNYWFDLMPKDATLEQMMNLARFVNPKIKKYIDAKQNARNNGVDADKVIRQAESARLTGTSAEVLHGTAA